MIEKKFRVWNTQPGNEGWLEYRNGFCLNLDGVLCCPTSDKTLSPASEDFKVMQYTGLKDKNGKEIYEGDIVRILYTDWPSQPREENGRYSMSLEEYKKSISVVKIVKYFAPEYFACNPETDACSSILPGKHGEIEVIGNVYQDPELLNVKAD